MRFPWEALRSSTGPVRVGGHSKGGNLAVFAAMSLSDDERLRVTHVYDNDGPGLSRDIVDQPALAELAGKITKVVPEFTVIGRLFNDVPATHIVASNGRGLLQHDIMTWQVEGTALVERDAESARSALINRLVDAWLEEAAPEDRRDFTDALFSALGAGGATLVQDTARREHGSFESILFHLVRARSKTRRSVRTTMRVLGRSLAAVDYRALLQQRRALQAVVLIGVGIVFIQAPALAIQVLGAFATLVVSVAVAVAVRLLGYLRRFRRTHNVRWPWVAAGVGLFVLLLYGLEHIEALVTPTNLLLGVVLIAAAISRTMDALHELHAPAPRHIRTVLLSLSAIVGVLMGIVALATAGRVLPLFVLEVGLFFLVTGLIEVFFALHDRVRRAYVDASFMESAAHASRRGEPFDRPPRHGPSRPVRRP